MISVSSIQYCGIELEAFPDVVISFCRIDELLLASSEVETLLNKPGLYHWVLIVEEQVPLEEIIGWFSFNAYENMRQLLMMYTIIPVGNRRSLKRKMCGPEYFRSYNSASLHNLNLKWISAKYAYAEPRKVLFMQSPILLFDRSVSIFFADSWFSAFVSLLGTGVLELVVSHTHFCLGTFKANPSEVLSE